MSVSQKFEAGGMFPLFTWPAVDGGKVTPAAGKDWRLPLSIAVRIVRSAQSIFMT